MSAAPAGFNEYLKQQGYKRGDRLDGPTWNMYLQKFQTEQQSAQAAPGLMRELWRRGMPKEQADGTWTTPWTEEMKTAVNLLGEPTTRGLGTEMATGLLGPGSLGRAAEVTAQARKAEREEAQASIRDPLEVERLRQEVEQGRELGPLKLLEQRYQTRRAQLAYDQALLAAAAPVPVTPYGEPPKGSFPAQAPGGEIQYIPQPGSEAYNKAQEAIRSQEQVIKNLHLMQTMIEQAGSSGTEWAGPLSRQIAFVRGNIAANLFKLREYGAPQAAELELAFQQLPDPTGFTRNVMGLISNIVPFGVAADYSRETIQAPYGTFREMSEEALRALRRTYWYVDHSQGLLPEDPRAH